MEFANNISTVILFGVIVAALWLLYSWFYREYLIDKTRQQLFAVRDDLFDYADSGKISFDHPAYGMLRQSMNGMIRFTHELNFFSLIAFSVISIYRPKGKGFHERLNSALSELDEPVSEELLTYLTRMNIIIIRHIVKSSFFTILIVGFIPVCFLAFSHGIRGFKRTILENFPGISNIDNEAAIRGGLSVV